jgi:hypothetical protein
MMRKWMLRVGVMLLGGMLLVGTLLWALSGSGHNPNHDIDMEKAREAADRVHPQPDPAVRAKMKPGHGG